MVISKNDSSFEAIEKFPAELMNYEMRRVFSILLTMSAVLILVIQSLKADEFVPKSSANEYSFAAHAQGEFSKNIARFVVGEFVVSDGEVRRILPYRLFVPKHLADDIKYPLLIWLHGYGESGNDNWKHLVYIKEEVARWEDQKSGFPCFVLAPQSPLEGHWDGKVLSAIFQLIQATTANWTIDMNRIYVSGVSSGGSACWKIGQTYPDLFAAISPMASGGTADLTSLGDTPVWAFHVARDPGTSPMGVRRTVASLQNQGGKCWLTETAGDAHDCWSAAFNDYQITDWLLKQRRGGDVIPPPAWTNWLSFRSRYLTWNNLWQIAILCSVFAVVLVAIRNHLKNSRDKITFDSKLNVPTKKTVLH